MGVNGEAKELFVVEGKCALHFEPENLDQLVAQIQRLMNDPTLYQELSTNARKYIPAHFSREELAQKFWQRIQQL
jgi:glycosyltransferase involved in cell wall biosynthesis